MRALVKRVIGGHWIWSPRMLRLAQENKIEAYCLPSGAITNLFREIGARATRACSHMSVLEPLSIRDLAAAAATTSRRKTSSN